MPVSSKHRGGFKPAPMLSRLRTDAFVEGAVDHVKLLFLRQLDEVHRVADTRIVSCGYFSGCAMASSSVSRVNTLTLMWCPPSPK